jgi:serine/threonine-protein kinase
MSEITSRLKAALADRYAIQEELGAGGMATVYLAEDLKHHRKVAVKVLRPELAATLGPERFLREIEISANLNHPHILPLFDSGEADGFLYYVMPYVEGESLRDRLSREKQLPIHDALKIAGEVADALGSAHKQEVIHRDIKPENILLEEGHAVVADFGIALAVSAAGGERLTGTGFSLGTPEYMSPEQATGEQLGARSDIYSLASVLYEMLTGEPPYVGSTAQVVIAKRFSDPVPSARRLRDSIPASVDSAIKRALAKAPTDRFTDMREFATSLAAKQAEVETEAKSIVVLPFENLSADPEQEYFSDGITEEIINALTQLQDLHVAARTSSFWFKGKSPEITEVGEKLKVATVLEGSVRKAGNRLRITAQLVNVADGYHVWSERYDRELDDVFAIQDEIARAIADRMNVALGKHAGVPLVTPPTENLEAYDLYLKGRFFISQMGEGPRKGLEYFQQALACDPEYALAHAGVADAYNFLGDIGIVPPHEAKPRAREAAKRALELNETLAEAHVALGWLSWTYDFEWSNAEKHFLRAIELNPDLAEVHSRYGFFLFWIRGRFEEAVAEARRGVGLDPLAEIGHTWLGIMLACRGRLPDAIDQLRTAVELEPTSWHANNMLGMAHRLNSNFAEATAALQTAIAMAGRHPWSLVELGLTYAAQGNKERAEAIHDELVARSRGEFASPGWLALLCGVLGRQDEAFEWLDRAYEERDVVLANLKHLPHSDPLRDDPRFDELMKKMGLE